MIPIAAAETPVATTAPPADGSVLVIGLVLSGYDKPFNPILGDLLGYNHLKAGEFALYDEYNPMRKIILTANGTTKYDFLLNFNTSETGAPQATATGFSAVATDGNDAIFGGTGNDWLVGGTGRDTSMAVGAMT